MQIIKAERKQSKIKLAISGASGSGKTYSTLQLAYGLCGSWEKVCLIDSENFSASLYSNLGSFNIINLEFPFSPERYIQAIKLAEDGGMEVIIIDSITQEWTGKALHQKDEYLLPIRLDNTIIEGFNGIACINYNQKSDVEIVSMVCKKLGLEKPFQTLASFFHSKQKKERLLFELKSNKDFGGFFTMDTYIVNNNLLKIVGLKDTTIIGCEVNPHRIQLSPSPKMYEYIRNLFISGKLNELTGTTWNSLSPSSSASKLRIPLQSPLLISSQYNELDFNPDEQTVVCHLSGINGHTIEAKRAIEVIGNASTNNVRECKAYVTKTKAHLYVHSNFKKPDCPYTTKIGTNQKISLFTLLLKLTCLEYLNKTELQILAENHVNYVKYYFDKKTILTLDDNFLCGAENIQFV